MIFQSIVLILMTTFLVGCATTRQPSEVGRLQITVSQLEKKIEERDQEINDLKDQVQDLSGQVESLGSASETTVTQIKTSLSDAGSYKSDDDRIIRVAASAEEVQKALKGAGYYDGDIDGKIGAKTQKAISAFQKDHGLKGDGIIGKKTWMELKKYL